MITYEYYTVGWIADADARDIEFNKLGAKGFKQIGYDEEKGQTLFVRKIKCEYEYVAAELSHGLGLTRDRWEPICIIPGFNVQNGFAVPGLLLRREIKPAVGLQKRGTSRDGMDSNGKMNCPACKGFGLLANGEQCARCDGDGKTRFNIPRPGGRTRYEG